VKEIKGDDVAPVRQNGLPFLTSQDFRPPKKRWSDMEELAPWNVKDREEGTEGLKEPMASRRAARDHRACQTSTLDVTTIKNNLQVSQ